MFNCRKCTLLYFVFKTKSCHCISSQVTLTHKSTTHTEWSSCLKDSHVHYNQSSTTTSEQVSMKKQKPGKQIYIYIYPSYKNKYTHFTITGSFAAIIRHVVPVFTLTAKCSSCSDSESKQKHRSHVRFLRKLHKYVKSINLLPCISFLVPVSSCINACWTWMHKNSRKQHVIKTITTIKLRA